MAYEGLLSLIQQLSNRNQAPIFPQMGMNPANIPALPDFSMDQEMGAPITAPSVPASPAPASSPVIPYSPMSQSPQMMQDAPMAAPTFAPAPSNGGTGFMDFIQSPAARGMLYGAGVGLLKRVNDRNASIIEPALAGAEKFKKDDAMKQAAQGILGSNLTPAQRSFVQAAFVSGDPKLMEAATKILTAEPNKPITVGKGSRVIDPSTGRVIYESPNEIEKTDLQNNLLAAGIDPASDQGKKLITDYYTKIGGKGAGGVKGQLWDQFITQVQNDNPNLTPTQLQQVVNAHINNDETLPDGTPVPTLSALANERLNSARRGSTTSSLITQGVQANQAETEIKVLKDFAQAGLKKFGDTYGNYSPSQIAATLSSSKQAAKDLGKFVASQQLQFEIAQNQIKLANGQPGVTTTQELMDLGMQHINAKYPKMSYEARREAQDYFTKALGYGLKARNRIGIGVGAATGITNLTPAQKKLLEQADYALANGADPETVYSRIDEFWSKK